jgi:citrate synthase
MKEAEMASLHDKLASQIPGLRDEIRALGKEHASKVISEVTVAQAFGGMRGVKGLICDTSVVEPDQGLVVRGLPIGQLAKR